MKWTKIIVIDLLLLGVLFIGFMIIGKHYYQPPLQIKGVFIKDPKEIADINLIDHHGHPFNKAQLKNRWTFIFFGFTHCPIICPTTLDSLNKMYRILQKELTPNLLPQVVFITIDPERDSISRLKQFMNIYNSHFIGAKIATGKTNNFEKQLSLEIANINGNIIHSTDILLLNPEAKIQAYFLYPHHPLNIANDYIQIIKATSKSEMSKKLVINPF